MWSGKKIGDRQAAAYCMLSALPFGCCLHSPEHLDGVPPDRYFYGGAGCSLSITMFGKAPLAPPPP